MKIKDIIRKEIVRCSFFQREQEYIRYEKEKKGKLKAYDLEGKLYMIWYILQHLDYNNKRYIVIDDSKVKIDDFLNPEKAKPIFEEIEFSVNKLINHPFISRILTEFFIIAKYEALSQLDKVMVPYGYFRDEFLKLINKYGWRWQNENKDV